jgi:hypothetical protein
MGIPLTERRVLRKMQRRLRRCDAALTARFALFTRLAEDEPLPAHEQLPRSPQSHHHA